MAPFAASDVLRLQWLLTATDVQRKLALFFRATKANFNPDQPRVPAGNPDGGQWTDAGGGSSSSDRSPKRHTDIGTQRRSRARGHHKVPQALYKNQKLDPETRKVFDNASMGRMHVRGHRWDEAHVDYNSGVKDLMGHFLDKNGIRLDQMTPEHARSLLAEIDKSQDPRIRDYNNAIRLLQRLYRLRIGRGLE